MKSSSMSVICPRLMCRVNPFMFAESTITGTSYLDMLEIYAFFQIADIKREKGISAIFQQDKVPAHNSHNM